MAILIRKVKDSYGWLGNMSPYPVTFEGEKYNTTEALFQCLRFKDQEVIKEIRDQKSPMAAKMIAKKHKNKMLVSPLSNQDLDNMRLVLNLKVQQHPNLKTDLLRTKEHQIIEDCSKRPRGSGLFWGAAFKNNSWIGENWLGKLWMEIRDEDKKN